MLILGSMGCLLLCSVLVWKEKRCRCWTRPVDGLAPNLEVLSTQVDWFHMCL